jgi:hypothetical protein
MKYLLLVAALSFGASGLCLAQTSTPSDNSSAHSKASTAPNDPSGQAMQPVQGVKPCSNQASGTSDRNGGNEKRSTVSGGPNSNPGGTVSGSC